jgi:hypothetical protein
MPEFRPPELFPPNLFAEAPMAAMNAGMTLLSRRAAATAEFWRSFAAVRDPSDLMALQLNYWTQLVDDCQEALAESMPQAAASGPQGVAGAQQRSARRA